MNKLEKGLLYAALIVGVVALLLSLKGGKTMNTVTERVKEIVGATPGGEFHFPVKFYDRIIHGRSFLTTTTPQTLTGHTLVATDFSRPELLRIVTLGGAENTDYTFTLPASSSLADIAPNVGDREEICYYVTASTSKHRLLFAGGTGVDLTIATTTLNAATSSLAATTGIPQNGFGCLDFFREPRANDNSANLGQAGNLNVEIKFRTNADNTNND